METLDLGTSRDLTRPSLTGSSNEEEKASRINKWLQSSKGWIATLGTWRTESKLLEKLAVLTFSGQESIFPGLVRLHERLHELQVKEIAQLEKSIAQCQNQVNLMRSNMLCYEQKFQSLKRQMKSLEARYTALKTDLLEQLTRAYPLTII